MVPVDEATALFKSQQMYLESSKGGATEASNTVSSGWIKLTMTSTKIYDSRGIYTGRIQLKNSFQWLSDPNWKIEDAVGISHSSSAVQVPGSTYAKYTWNDGSVTKSLNYYTPKKAAPEGMVFMIDLQALGNNAPPSNHRGYMYFEIKKGSSTAKSANAYAHYTHLYFTATLGFSIQSGSISVTGATGKKDATTAYILFDY
jgi:hypothetical protein